jgi:hypothetical protein
VMGAVAERQHALECVLDASFWTYAVGARLFFWRGCACPHVLDERTVQGRCPRRLAEGVGEGVHEQDCS